MKNRLKCKWLLPLLATLFFLPGAALSNDDADERNWSRAGEMTALNDKAFVVDVFWSMRSPYCYIALDRILEIREKYNVDFVFRPIWPIAIKDPKFFKGIEEYMSYRIPYQDLDTLRSAQFVGIPYKYPNPDPVLQAPNFGPVKPMEEQPLIKLLTYTAAAAAEMGKGWEYLDQVSRMMWNGSVPKEWDKGDHIRNAINRAGIDADKLIKEVGDHPEKYDAIIAANQKLQDDYNSGGVPLFVFRSENFFGQDRIDQLMWRMKLSGLKERNEK